MTKAILTLLASFLVSSVIAQNLFPRKFDNCATEVFCLDCGDTKVSIDDQKLNVLITRLQKSNDLKGLSGKIMFQILVDSLGRGCVLSHTDVSDHAISKNITTALNAFDGFIPAQTKGKAEPRTSFNMSFEVKEGTIVAKVERVNMNAFRKSFDRPRAPEIYNKTYTYNNEHLKTYKITVWNKGNSGLPNNMNDHLTIDRKGTIWLTADDDLVTFDGYKFSDAGGNVTDKGKHLGYYAIATDNDNVKWVYGGRRIYSYDDKGWKAYDPKVTGINGAYQIINNPATAEVFFCSDEGVTVYKNGRWDSLINKQKFRELPSSRVDYAKRDSKNRIWIGTFGGSAMIDEQGKLLNFEATTNVLKGKCITSMDEDEEGNIYFTIFEFNRKDKTLINNDEGIVIWYKNGTVKQFTTSNSGMPFNHTTGVLYDKKEKVLWISTDRAGLVRYDLKDGWENYHSENSEIPTSYISTMSFDNEGILYLATRQGLVRIERK